MRPRSTPAIIADVEEVELVVAHKERATLRVGAVFLKIDADQTRTDVEVEAMALAPIPTPQILWRKPPVLALAAVPGTRLGHLGEPSTASSAAWVATGAAVRALHDAPVPVMFLAVQQHQPAPEERADQQRPAAGVEGAGAVLQHGAAGLGGLGVDPRPAEGTGPVDRAKALVERVGVGEPAGRECDGVPEQGQDEVADLARQFNAAAERVENLVKSHKSLLANASHELRSPLTRIRMGLELMGGQQTSPAFRQEIERNIAELDQLVDEILLASRLDAREADVGTVEVVDLIGLAAEECVRVDADLDVGSDSVDVRGVSKLLRRAIRNLLENARRYSAGEITLAVERRQGHAEVRVCDHGPGVPPNQRERIFEPFYRLPGASERAGGVGLGLALVRSIAGRHNGTVHCEDRPDGAPGACFVLRLPLP